MADLIGSCIENTKDISDTIKITLSINDSMNQIAKLFQQEQVLQDSLPSSEIQDKMKASIGIIHDLYEKLLSDRKKGNIEEFTYDETVDHIKILMEKSDLHYKKK